MSELLLEEQLYKVRRKFKTHDDTLNIMTENMYVWS